MSVFGVNHINLSSHHNVNDKQFYWMLLILQHFSSWTEYMLTEYISDSLSPNKCCHSITTVVAVDSEKDTSDWPERLLLV